MPLALEVTELETAHQLTPPPHNAESSPMPSRQLSTGAVIGISSSRIGTINNIQALRAIAAMMVVIEHIDFVGVGWSGVDIFFVISGFVIAKTGSRSDAKQFYMRRLFRVVPIYWLGTMMVFAAALVAPHLLGHTTTNPLALIKSLFFIPYVKSSGLVEPVLFLGWTLNFEMFFYTIYALSIWLSPAHRSLSVGLVIAMLIGLGAALHVEIEPFKFWTNPIMAEFVVGLIVFDVWNRGYLNSCPGWLAVVAVTALIAVILSLERWSVDWHFYWLRPLILGVPAVLIVSLALASERSIRAPLALLAVGDASYSLYLFHPYVLQPAQAIFGHFTRAVWWDAPVAAVLILASSVLALVAYRLVERPSNLWLRERFGRLQMRLARAPALGEPE